MQVLFSPYQHIATKYLGPTNTRGSRIKAWTSSGLSVVINYDYALNSEDNHVLAAEKIATKVGWTKTEWVATTTETGYVFTQLPVGSLTHNG